MKNIERLKIKQLAKLTQVVLLDEQGFIVESCDSIFSTETLRENSTIKWNPFIESIFDILLGLRIEDEDLYFAKLEAPASFLPGYYDYSFSREEYNGKLYILWSIFDYTNLYTDFLNHQQRRNELEIRWQLMDHKGLGMFYHKNANSNGKVATEVDYYLRVREILHAPINALDGLTFTMPDMSQNGHANDYLNNLQYSTQKLQAIITEIEGVAANSISLFKKAKDFELQTLVNHILQSVAKWSQMPMPIKCNWDFSLPQQLKGNHHLLKQTIYCLLLSANQAGKKPKLSISLAGKTDNNRGIFQFLFEQQTADRVVTLDPDHSEDLILWLSVAKKLLEIMEGNVLVRRDNDNDSTLIECRIPFNIIG